ncbi:Hypp4110 [Branchiostoma lanceolatum]|uniref:Hypp4109 protein n=2 Tax=Branchiostoma lanceolatum TaxID=7740 RepID=A0A8K0A5D9_BRALA|nr:Hypp4109 [Branchiostoma lanceolatum]CAH1269154.1 Hypp4110 [Branchiostoma lanceolatum]
MILTTIYRGLAVVVSVCISSASEPFCRKEDVHSCPGEREKNREVPMNNFRPPTPRPELVVFDVDFTLWPFWVDTHVSPPFKKTSDGRVVDRHNYVIKGYEDVPEILEWMSRQGYTMAVASRTDAEQDMRKALKLLDWDKYFTYKEIYPGSKTRHFARFHEQSGIPYSKMIFFDDEERNIYDLNRIGVLSLQVDRGLTLEVLQNGLEKFARERK